MGISFSLGAQADLPQELDTARFEKILLDNKEAYIQVATKKIFTKEAYQSLISGNSSEVKNIGEVNKSINLAITESLEYWDTLKVNPFPKIKLKEPFEISFNDLDYAPPVDGKMVITSHFGRRRRGPHRGIDIDLVTGDEVKTILPGKVRFVGYSRGHGRTVIVRHENDIETLYAHLSSYDVKTNDIVEKGQVLGKGGISGNARGSHLHMEMRHRGITMNPEYLLNFKGENTIRGNTLWVTKGIVNPDNHSSYQESKMDVLSTKELALEGQKNERRIHVVRKGDTLWAIARKNGMRVQDIVNMNKRISSRSTLRIGQHLVITP